MEKRGKIKKLWGSSGGHKTLVKLNKENQLQEIMGNLRNYKGRKPPSAEEWFSG